MKKYLVAFALVSKSLLAYADGVKPAVIDVSCVNSIDDRVIYIVSSEHGSRILVNSQIVYEGEQLTAGTEGGPAYLQAVGGGYNIFIEGGAFEQAFGDSISIESGEAPARIWSQESGVSIPGTCTGLYSFEIK